MNCVLLLVLAVGPLAANGGYFYPRVYGDGWHDNHGVRGYGHGSRGSPHDYWDHDHRRHGSTYPYYRRHGKKTDDPKEDPNVDKKDDKSDEKKDGWKWDDYDKPWQHSSSHRSRSKPAPQSRNYGRWAWKSEPDSAEKKDASSKSEELVHQWWDYRNHKKPEKKDSSEEKDDDCKDDGKENSWEDYWHPWVPKKKCNKNKEKTAKPSPKKHHGYGHSDYWKRVDNYYKKRDEKKKSSEDDKDKDKKNDKKPRLNYRQYYAQHFGRRHPEDEDGYWKQYQENKGKPKTHRSHYYRHPFWKKDNKKEDSKEEKKTEEKPKEHDDYWKKYQEEVEKYYKKIREKKKQEEEKHRKSDSYWNDKWDKHPWERKKEEEKKEKECEEKKEKKKPDNKEKFDEWWKNLGRNYHGHPRHRYHHYY